jgi:hypothetical protein
MSEALGYNMAKESRIEKRYKPDNLCSVIMRRIGFPSYQFKVKDISSKGTCLLVTENSSILNELSIGDQLDIQYHYNDGSRSPEFLRAEVIHITKAEQNPLRGHYLIGIRII